MSSVPKIFHVVWIGDESKEPKDLIQSWADKHPDFEMRVYRNKEFHEHDWKFKDAMQHFYDIGEYCGAADLMRWEMLYEHGGMTLDADSLCLETLPEWMFDCETAACWDNGQVEGQLLANGFVIAKKNAPIIGDVIEKLQSEGIKYDRWSWSRMKRIKLSSWKSVGPLPFTQVALGHRKARRTGMTALPSHFFLPDRSDGVVYQGGGPVYACHFWGTTTDFDLSDNEAIQKIKDRFKVKKAS